MFNTRLPLKEAVRAANYFQHSLAPHAFCLTGEIWKASSELVPFPHFLPCSLWSPMPHEIRLASGRPGFFCLVRRQKDTSSEWLGHFRAPLSDHLCWGSGSWHLVVWGKMQKGPLLSEVGALSLTWNSTLTTNLFLLLTVSSYLSPVQMCITLRG